MIRKRLTRYQRGSGASAAAPGRGAEISPLRRAACACAAVALLTGFSADAAAPAIFWVSDPVLPGETVLIIGEGLGDTSQVEMARSADSGR